MRTMNWRPLLLLGLILCSGFSAVWAQGYPGGQYFYQNGPYPGYSGMEQAGWPPGAQAWPNITPYEPGMNQHYTENGFWFNRIISGQSRYFATMEALISRTSAPRHGLIGADGVNPVPPELILEGVVTNNVVGTRTGAFVETNGRVNNPDRELTPVDDGPFIAIFAPRNAGILQQHFGSGGMRGSFGWWNPDDSGLTVQGFWQDEAHSDFVSGDFNLPRDLVTTLAPDLLTLVLSRVTPQIGLPLPGADRDLDGLNGVVVPYDLYVSISFKSSIYGGNVDWYSTPRYDNGILKVRGLAGARILHLGENFTFQAADSGLGYTLESPTLTVGQGNGNGNNQNPFVIQIETLDQPPYDIPSATGPGSPITSYLQSRTNGLLAGPEVGLRFDLGSDRFKIWLQSKFGLLAYHSQRSINGFNIGDHYNIITTDANIAGLPEDPDVDGDDIADNPLRVAGIEGSRFGASTETTSVAPMFEQGVFMEAPLLSYVPIVNRMSVFNNAEFQLGYSILMLGNVYRPNNTIEWAQFPDFPTINSKKSKYYTTNWSLGVQWNF